MTDEERVKELSSKLTESKELYSKLGQFIVDTKNELVDLCGGIRCNTYIMKTEYFPSSYYDKSYTEYYMSCSVCGKYETVRTDTL